MSHKLLRTLVSLGMVDGNQVREFMRWGLLEPQLVLGPASKTLPESIERLELALEQAGYRKETDLDVPGCYEKTQTVGHIHAYLDGQMHPGIEVYYGRTKSGDYILPWSSEGFEEVLVNGRTYLDTGARRVYMMDSRAVYLDDRQSFVVCKPGTEEKRDGDDR